MALNKVYVFTGVSGGAGDGTSLANAFSSLPDAVAAASSKALAPGPGDTLEFVCSGAQDLSTGVLDFDESYTGTGKILLSGDHTQGPKFDNTSYYFENTTSKEPFRVRNCANIELTGFQYLATFDDQDTNLIYSSISDGVSTLPDITATDCYFSASLASNGTEAFEAMSLAGVSNNNPTNTPVWNFTNCVFDGKYNDVYNIRDLLTFNTTFDRCTFVGASRMLGYSTQGTITAADLVWKDCIFDELAGHGSVNKGTLTNCAVKVMGITTGVVVTAAISLPNAYSTYFTDSANSDYTVIDAAPLSGAGVSGGLVGSSLPVVALLVTNLLTQTIDLALWTAGSSGIVRGNDKPGDL